MARQYGLNGATDRNLRLAQSRERFIANRDKTDIPLLIIRQAVRLRPHYRVQTELRARSQPYVAHARWNIAGLTRTEDIRILLPNERGYKRNGQLPSLH